MNTYTPFIAARVWVLIIFGGLLASSQMMLQLTFSEQKNAGNVINVAGKQRMLSQRILSFSCIDIETSDGMESAAELLSATNLLVENHHVLIVGNGNVPIADETLEAELIGLNADVEELKTLVYGIVDNESDNLVQIKEIIDRFLPRMDLIVEGIVARSEAKVEMMNVINIVSDLFIAIVGVVLYRNYRIKRNQMRGISRRRHNVPSKSRRATVERVTRQSIA